LWDAGVIDSEERQRVYGRSETVLESPPSSTFPA
jgi:hypothetical protein